MSPYRYRRTWFVFGYACRMLAILLKLFMNQMLISRNRKEIAGPRPARRRNEAVRMKPKELKDAFKTRLEEIARALCEAERRQFSRKLSKPSDLVDNCEHKENSAGP